MLFHPLRVSVSTRISLFATRPISSSPKMLSFSHSLALSLLALLALLALNATSQPCNLPSGGVWSLVSGPYNTTVDTSAACQAAAAWSPGSGTQCNTTSSNTTVCQQAYNGTSGIVAGVTTTGLAACCPYDSWCQSCGSPCVGSPSYVCSGYTPQGQCIVNTCVVVPAYMYDKRSGGCPYSDTMWYSQTKVFIGDYFGPCSSSSTGSSSSSSTGASGDASNGISATGSISSSSSAGVPRSDNLASVLGAWNPLVAVVLVAGVVFLLL